jgi:phosphatidylinositol-3-phosphatase
MKTRYVAAASAGAIALALALPPIANAAGGTSAGRARPGPAHVFVIMMENAGSDELLNPANVNTSYIRSLVATYGFATDYFGVTHPSLPNYLAATSGSIWGSNSDDTAQKTLFDHRNIVDQLEAAHVSWKGYMEGLPYPGFLGDSADYTASPPSAGNALYLLKHNPFLLYPDVYNNPERAKKVVPLTQLSRDLANNTVPQFSWITPDICNDMHGMSGPACAYPSTGAGPSAQQYAQGDAFLQRWISKITGSKAWTKGSVIFVTWDEGGYLNVSPYSPVSTAGCCDSPILANPPINPVDVSGGDLTTGQIFGGGLVPMIVITAGSHRHLVDPTPANHYSLLRTIEALFHLGYLNQAGDSNQVHTLLPLIPR